jgi:HEAT repeat protein
MPMFGPPNIVKLQQKRNIDGLIKALSYKDSDVRFAAAFAVGRIGDPRAIPPLTTALNDENLNVREAAAIALGEIGDPQAIPALITALNDKDSNVRRLAVRALGEIGDPQAIPPLITALNDQNQDVRKAAAGALDTLHWSPGRDATGVAYWMGKGDWDRCVEIGVPAIEPLTKALNDRDWHVRKAAANSLVAMYSSIKGTVASRQILAAGSIITAVHVDWTGGDCSSHSDEGIGVRFPL